MQRFRGAEFSPAPAFQVKVDDPLETEMNGYFFLKVLRKVKVHSAHSFEFILVFKDKWLKVGAPDFFFAFDEKNQVDRKLFVSRHTPKGIEETRFHIAATKSFAFEREEHLPALRNDNNPHGEFLSIILEELKGRIN